MENTTRDPTTDVPCSSVSESFYAVFTTVPVFFLVLIGCVGIAGNSLVLFIIIKHRDMRTVTNFFVANLAVTDIALLLMCTFPEALVTYNLQNGWILGDFMCRATGYMQNVSIATCTLRKRFLASCNWSNPLPYIFTSKLFKRFQNHWNPLSLVIKLQFQGSFRIIVFNAYY